MAKTETTTDETIVEATAEAVSSETNTAVATKRKSGKTKEELGVPAGSLVTYVPLIVTEDQHETITRAAKTGGTDGTSVKVGKFLADMFAGHLFNEPGVWDGLIAQAANAPETTKATSLEDKSIDELRKLEEKIEAQKKKLQDAIAAASQKIKAAQADQAAQIAETEADAPSV